MSTQIHQSLIQSYSELEARKSLDMSAYAGDVKLALRELKDSFPKVWDDYKCAGKPTLLVSSTQAQTLRTPSLPKSQLKSLILELGAVFELLKKETKPEMQVPKVDLPAKRPWSISELAGLMQDIDSVDRTTKQKLRDGIQTTRRKLFSRE